LEAENQQILNAIDEGIIGLDLEGRITYINPAATKICGWAAADAIGESLHGLRMLEGERGATDGEEQTLPYRAYRLGETVHSDMELIRRRDGNLVPVALICSARPEGGAVLVLRDIGAWLEHEEDLRHTREEMESQRQSMAHMERLSTSGEMAAGIAHEVNQPLTAVVNYARVGKRLIERGDIDRDKLMDILSKVDTQAVRASDVIQRLRSYVKKPDIGRRRVDLNILMQEVIALAEVDSRINDVPIHLEFEGGLPPILVDVVQIQQVALNLLRNAMEAMAGSTDQQHGVVVQTLLDDGRVCFRVIDRGHGLSEAAREQLFRPFFTTKTNGMGIGLSICQSIVQAHSGAIGCDNNPEGGATFFCCLPPAEDVGPLALSDEP
jgi:PAS domain S-box-containing protein